MLFSRVNIKLYLSILLVPGWKTGPLGKFHKNLAAAVKFVCFYQPTDGKQPWVGGFIAKYLFLTPHLSCEVNKLVGNLGMDEPLWLINKWSVTVRHFLVTEQRFTMCKPAQSTSENLSQSSIWCVGSFACLTGRPARAHARRWCSLRSPHTGTSPGRPALRGRSTTLSPSPWKITTTTRRQTVRWDDASCSGTCSCVENLILLYQFIYELSKLWILFWCVWSDLNGKIPQTYLQQYRS